MSSTRNPGRVAGLLYLLLVIFGPLRLIYIPSKLFVHGNATATASNIVAPDCLFSINRPYARRGEFEQMPVRISKIEAPAAQFPCPLLFHGDASRLEP